MVKGAKQEVGVPLPYLFHRYRHLGESEMRGVEDKGVHVWAWSLDLVSSVVLTIIVGRNSF